MSHTCHAIDCTKKVPPKMLMCRRHWYMVDKPLRDKVWETYIAEQEITKNPSHEYLYAAREAIECVRKIEKTDFTYKPDKEICGFCGYELNGIYVTMIIQLIDRQAHLYGITQYESAELRFCSELHKERYSLRLTDNQFPIPDLSEKP